MNTLFSETIRGGHMWSKVIRRGRTVRLTDLEGGANAGVLLYNADEKIERYNMPDTLKGQHIFFLTAPCCVHSDMGRLLASIARDTCGWHDTVCGCSDAALVRKKYGKRTFQEARNDYYRNGRDCFLVELAKWGMGARDLVPNINFFSKVVADEAGHLQFVSGHSPAGASVDLRLEMNTLVVLQTCPHPLDPATAYSPKPVQIEVFPAPPVGPDDACRLSRPENARALTNTEIYNMLRFGGSDDVD